MSRINLFFCESAGCWIADYPDNWIAYDLHGTTEIPLFAGPEADPEEIADELAAENPSREVIICWRVPHEVG